MERGRARGGPTKWPQTHLAHWEKYLYVDFLLSHRSEMFLPMFWTAWIEMVRNH